MFYYPCSHSSPSVSARVHSAGSMYYGTKIGRVGWLPPGLIFSAVSKCGWPVSRVLSRATPRGGAGMAIHLGPWSPTASCGLPGQRAGGGPGHNTLSSLSDLAPGGACRAAPVAGGAVGSYPAVSPLPERTPAVCSLWRFPWGSRSPFPPPGVTRHRASVEPGLSSPSTRRWRGAAIRPSAACT